MYKTKAEAQAAADELNKKAGLIGSLKKYVPVKEDDGWELVLRYNEVTVTGKRSGILVLIISLLSLIKYI